MTKYHQQSHQNLSSFGKSSKYAAKFRRISADKPTEINSEAVSPFLG